MESIRNAYQKTINSYNDGSMKNSIFKLLGDNSLFVTILIFLALFSILSYLTITNDYFGLKQDYRYLAAIAIYFGFFLFFVASTYYFKYYDISKYPNLKDEYDFVSKGTWRYTYIGLGIISSVLFFYGMSLFNSYYPQLSSTIGSFSVIVLAIGILALFVYYFDKENNTKGLDTYDDKPTIFNILKHTILYIPCLFLDLAKLAYNEFKITPNVTYMVLLFQAIIIGSYFLIPMLIKLMFTFMTHESKTIVNDPVPLDEEIQHGNFQDLTLFDNDVTDSEIMAGSKIEVNDGAGNYEPATITDIDDNNEITYTLDNGGGGGKTTLANIRIPKSVKPNHNFCISTWVFLENDYKNNEFYNVLDYASKPKIEYNAMTNQLRFTIRSFDKNYVNTENTNFSYINSGGNQLPHINIDHSHDASGNSASSNLQSDSKKKRNRYEKNDEKSNDEIVLTYDNVLQQKWNNIVINFDGNALDIFINGKIVYGNVGVIPYLDSDSIITGDTNGVNGGICNTMYYSHRLNSSAIYYLYNFLSLYNPPLL